MRVLIVDDHAVVRDGLALLLQSLAADIEVSHASDCTEALAMSGQPFDFILLDLQMPGTDGLDALHAVRLAFPAERIVVLSGLDEPLKIRQAIEGGAAGFVPKALGSKLLIAVLRLILAGGIYLPPTAVRDLPGGRTAAMPDASAGRAALDALGLTDRQLEVLCCVIDAKSNKRIARELGIAESTVKQHVSEVFRRLDVGTRLEAVKKSEQLGLRLPPLSRVRPWAT